MVIIDEDYFLEHYGKKGMKWGQRRALKKISYKELKNVNRQNKAAEKSGKKETTRKEFRREVKLTRRGKGITGTNRNVTVTPIGGLLTSRMRGNFKNSRGEKISEDFANAVMTKAVNQKEFQRKAASGAILAGVLIGTLALRTRR